MSLSPIERSIPFLSILNPAAVRACLGVSVCALAAPGCGDDAAPALDDTGTTAGASESTDGRPATPDGSSTTLDADSVDSSDGGDTDDDGDPIGNCMAPPSAASGLVGTPGTLGSVVRVQDMVATDDDGLVVFGYFGELDLGAGPIASTSLTGEDAFVARLGADLGLVWTQTIPAWGGDGIELIEAGAVAIDAMGDIVVISQYFSDANIHKLDGATGEPIYALDMVELDLPMDLAAADDGDVVVIGRSFCGGPGCGSLGRLTRLDPTANVVWQRSYGAEAWVYPSVVAIDSNDEITWAGALEGTLGPDEGSLSAPAGGIAVLRTDGDGNPTGGTVFPGSTAGLAVTDLVHDPCGGTYLYGELAGTIDFGGQVLASAGWTDLFLAHLDGDSVTWARRFGGPDIEDAGRLSVDPAGSVVVTGNLTSAQFGSTTLVVPNGIVRNGFAARINRVGTELWARLMASQIFGDARAVVHDSSGRAWVGADINATTTIDSVQVAPTADYSTNVLLIPFDP